MRKKEKDILLDLINKKQLRMFITNKSAMDTEEFKDLEKLKEKIEKL